MDTAATVVRSPATPCKPSILLVRSAVLTPNGSCFACFASSPRFSPKLHHVSVSIPRQGHRRRGLVVIVAASSPEPPGSSSTKIAPLQLELPIRQFLSQILMNHPHLVPAAVDQQLEQLQTDPDADQQNQEPSASGTDLVLYRMMPDYNLPVGG